MLKYFLLSFTFFVSCSKNPIDAGKYLYLKDGIYFDKKGELPFTGKYYLEHNSVVTEKGFLISGHLNKDWYLMRDSSIYIKGSFKNGKKLEYDSYGVSKDGREGNWKIFYDSGQILEESNYVNGLRHGIFTQWYGNGKRKIESNFIKGNFHGQKLEWDQKGNLLSENNYNFGKKSGFFKEWYSNGEKSSEKKYDSDSLVNGTHRSWYQNGQISKEITKYGNESRTVYFYKDGIKSSEFSETNGKYHGDYIVNYESGIKSLSATYKNGKLHDWFRRYDSDGDLVVEGRFLDGELFGNWSIYGRGEWLKFKANFDDGYLADFVEYKRYSDEIEFSSYRLEKQIKYSCQNSKGVDFDDCVKKQENYFKNKHIFADNEIREAIDLESFLTWDK